MRLKRYLAQQGGSLLEVMISLFILSLPVFGMTALKLTQAQIILKQSQYTTAWALMEFKLNELHYLAGSIAEFNTLSSNIGGNLAAGNIHYDQHKFNLTWQVSVITTKTTLSLLKEVVVKVNWIDKANTPYTISSMTILNQGLIVR
ncbi:MULTISPECIES: hypothetical protein [unclassified Moritella]|uniref:type IV pilus modification PilV family protein n=1 Tax=unclassified Moritella TaxID=2637987 RepID=UPI001BA552DC|nr:MULTISPECIES: hypothetical protein [unclassified Moritella]QUM86369.1 hypothetical protein HWV02_18580 [Moritella sp. 28]QUM90602.1 hypothetical protein HWV03_18300 [Moritella sp. 36]